MTIEKNIQDLTQAIAALTAVLSNKTINSCSETIICSTPSTEGKVEKKSPKITDAEIVTETTKPAKKAGKVEAPKAEEDISVEEEKEITIEVLKERTTVFGETKGREATIALLKEFGAAKGSEVAPEKRKQYVARLEALLKA